MGRVQRQLSALVVTEMLSRVEQPISGPPLLVKGGTALEFRLGLSASRTSKDLDAVVRGDLDDFMSLADEAVKIPWAGFTGRVTRRAEVDIPGLTVKPRRFEVKLSFRGKAFATVPVEISAAEAGAAAEYEEVSAPPLDGLGFEPAAPVPCLSIRFQIAQKIHACTDPLTPGVVNTRARDLVDLLLMEPLVDDEQLPAVREACAQIFAARARHSWPPVLQVPAVWVELYPAAAEGLEDYVPADVHRAAAAVQLLINRIAQHSPDDGQPEIDLAWSVDSTR
ncbi:MULTISPECIES: nucleotidyl transferase AbiEii/AbiGii toxin family protein [Micromonospora]|uniref:nucleotidyl transferase AbiEii/AbiGii toxin family protein n=1 Tax=Micromonospora TaxID=1873 RepID=UPI00311DE52A